MRDGERPLGTLYDRIADADWNVLAQFLVANGHPIAATAIEDRLHRLANGEQLSLGLFARALNALDVRFEAVLFDRKAGLPPDIPFLVPLRQPKVAPGEPTAVTFVIATSLGAGTVPVCLNGHGDKIALSTAQWSKRWNGIAVKIVGPPPVTWHRHDAGLRREQDAAAAYLETIASVNGLVSPDLCDRIMALCRQGRMFRRSTVSRTRTISRARTSYSRDLQGALAAALDAELRRQPVLRDLEFETFQIVRYRPGERFLAHLDAGPEVVRELTAIVYLNDGFAGGATSFPNLKRNWSARKGRGLIFRNIDEHGDPIRWSLHAGEMVTDGEKYVCNVWSRDVAHCQFGEQATKPRTPVPDRGHSRAIGSGGGQ